MPNNCLTNLYFRGFWCEVNYINIPGPVAANRTRLLSRVKFKTASFGTENLVIKLNDVC